LLTWLPLLLMMGVGFEIEPHSTPGTAGLWLLGLVCVCAMIRCITVPERSFADCLAGTWMVPR
jgi:hypothetical protein